MTLKITPNVFVELESLLPLLNIEYEVSENGHNDKALFLVQAGYVAVTPKLFRELKIDITEYPWSFRGLNTVVMLTGFDTQAELNQWHYISRLITK